MNFNEFERLLIHNNTWLNNLVIQIKMNVFISIDAMLKTEMIFVNPEVII